MGGWLGDTNYICCFSLPPPPGFEPPPEHLIILESTIKVLRIELFRFEVRYTRGRTRPFNGRRVARLVGCARFWQGVARNMSFGGFLAMFGGPHTKDVPIHTSKLHRILYKVLLEN